MTYLIGVDCGGTHIVGQVWAPETDQLIQSVTGGPGNVVFDPDGAMANLTHVLDRLITPREPGEIGLILLGIAGIETSGKQADVTSAIQRRYQIETQVISDAKLALLNGLQGEDGALVISGTGSVVYGRQHGEFLRVGGWGYILGDEGSAYDISKAALKRVLDQADAGQTDGLTLALLKGLKTTSIATAVATFYAQDRKTNAELAMIVADLADKGNPDAIALLKSRARALAGQVLTLYARFIGPRPQRVALSGTVLQHNQLVRQTLIDAVHQVAPAIEFIDIPTNNAHAVVFWPKWQHES
ncbi:BadF/BadG/BcrA/BcrD ATPase family protein [Lacticaseibacillus absianus]|uniref:BadF/BadG/BcrA/BcrD ATPase family protein n=1 Tax=Lacticaseibacillus absianus TaxID=2729623 RepID=UPI0015CD38E4|nr:BadF/BadG/BcrA/BcrD ATPase family protein [Lacticaseibacillus absianus]